MTEGSKFGPNEALITSRNKIRIGNPLGKEELESNDANRSNHPMLI